MPDRGGGPGGFDVRLTPRGSACAPEAEGAIRPLIETDVEPLRSVIEATDMFEPALLDGMVDGYLSGASSERWLTASEGRPIAVAYYAPERLTDGTWNLLLIAVHPNHQGRGWGTALVQAVERELATRRQRLLLVETSGRAEFEPVRDFYRRRGYAQVAVIGDFYEQGDDKCVFRKAIA